MARILKMSEAASLAMHTVVLLAVDPQQVLSTHGIARRLDVSEAHLAKVLQRLAKTGFVRPVRGPRGGFAIGKTPSRITLLKVYEAIDGKLESTSCLLDAPACGGKSCILGNLLAKHNKEIRDYLSQTTIAELTDVYGQ